MSWHYRPIWHWAVAAHAAHGVHIGAGTANMITYIYATARGEAGGEAYSDISDGGWEFSANYDAGPVTIWQQR